VRLNKTGMQNFNDKYRIGSNRYYRWDYSNTGLYFITIATENKIKHFGKIENENIILSIFGKIVKNEWEKSFEIRDELLPDESIIMPNHIHAIVAINKMEANEKEKLERGFYRTPKSLSSFVSGFKSGAINKIDDFIDENNLSIKKFNRKNKLWQANFHDHIIRNHEEYCNIKNYIYNNPKKWHEDEFHS